MTFDYDFKFLAAVLTLIEHLDTYSKLITVYKNKNSSPTKSRTTVLSTVSQESNMCIKSRIDSFMGVIIYHLEVNVNL